MDADLPDALPLSGRTVAVTAARRSEDLVALLARRGADVVEAPALRTVPVEDDEQLRAATRACLTRPLDVLVVTTAVGFRGWVTAADGWGLGDALRTRLASVEVLARGPKATGAVRGAGLRESWSPDSEASTEVLAHLLAQGVAGRTVAVQQHGEPVPGFTEALRDAGADVVEVPVYRWVPPQDDGPLRRLVHTVADSGLDAVTFTSAPAATSLLRTAEQEGVLDALVNALRGPVLAACVGPVTAAPLARAGVPTVQPERFRLADLVRTVVQALGPPPP